MHRFDSEISEVLMHPLGAALQTGQVDGTFFSKL